MLELPNVTLLTVTSKTYMHGAIRALKYSMKNIKFAEVLYISDVKPRHLPSDIKFKSMTEFNDVNDFNYFMVYDLFKYVDTDFALIVHYDGFVVHPECWRDDFLNYDFIGSPWPLPDENDKVTYRDINGNICRVGNSVSIRSKRLMELPSKINMPWEKFGGWYNEDGFICVNCKHIFEEHGMKYAPLDVAKFFGHESMIPEVEGITPFVFHKWAGTNSNYPNRIYSETVWLKERIKRKIHRTVKHG